MGWNPMAAAVLDAEALEAFLEALLLEAAASSDDEDDELFIFFKKSLYQNNWGKFARK